MNKPLPLLLLAATCLLAACGGDDKETAASTPTATATAADTPAASGGTTVAASEFKFDPASLTAKAGKVKVSLDNKGQFEHEFLLLKTDDRPDALKVSGGKVGEDDSVGEIEEIKGGAGGSHTFDLKPGHYVFVCNVPGHYEKGMRGELVVQ